MSAVAILAITDLHLEVLTYKGGYPQYQCYMSADNQRGACQVCFLCLCFVLCAQE